MFLVVSFFATTCALSKDIKSNLETMYHSMHRERFYEKLLIKFSEADDAEMLKDIKILDEMGVDIDYTIATQNFNWDYQYTSFLNLALYQGKLNTARYLFKKGADVNQKPRGIYAFTEEDKKWGDLELSPLWCAVVGNHIIPPLGPLTGREVSYENHIESVRLCLDNSAHVTVLVFRLNDNRIKILSQWMDLSEKYTQERLQCHMVIKEMLSRKVTENIADLRCPFSGILN